MKTNRYSPSRRISGFYVLVTNCSDVFNCSNNFFTLFAYSSYKLWWRCNLY